ncbi:hypothetical protein E4U35_002464 [Claviceps purpurea]|nr:hypothetical protein E4U35_002464 [Claviceps purpurea]
MQSLESNKLLDFDETRRSLSPEPQNSKFEVIRKAKKIVGITKQAVWFQSVRSVPMFHQVSGRGSSATAYTVRLCQAASPQGRRHYVLPSDTEYVAPGYPAR